MPTSLEQVDRAIDNWPPRRRMSTMRYPANLNTPTINPGKVSVADLDARINARVPMPFEPASLPISDVGTEPETQLHAVNAGIWWWCFAGGMAIGGLWVLLR